MAEIDLKECIYLLRAKLQPVMNEVLIRNFTVDWNAIKEEASKLPEGEPFKFDPVPEIITVKEVFETVMKELYYDKEQIYYGVIPDRVFIVSVRNAIGLEMLKDEDRHCKQWMIEKYIVNKELYDSCTFEFIKEPLSESVMESKFYSMSIEDYRDFEKSKPYQIKLVVKVKNKNEM